MVKFGVFWVSSGRSDQLAQAPIGKSGPDGQKRGKSGYFDGFGGVWEVRDQRYRLGEVKSEI